MSLIVTAEELEERITSTTTTFRFGKMFKVLVVEEVPEAFLDFFGSWSYRQEGMSGSDVKHFALSIGGKVAGDLGDISELTVLLKMAKTIERREKELKTQVFSVSLPKSLGFSGNHYGYRQVLELFPHLAS